MKEYIVSHNLQADFIEQSLFEKIHESTVIACHDVLLYDETGFYLILRDNEPEKGEWYPVGGRLLRGVSLEESLKQKVKTECGMDCYDISFLDVSRTQFSTEPFGHGKGTDSLNVEFIAKVSGECKLDSLHSDMKHFTWAEIETIGVTPRVLYLLQKAHKKIKE